MADFFQSQFLSWNFGFVAAWGSWPVYKNAPETIYITHRKTPGSDRINDSKKNRRNKIHNLTIREKFPFPSFEIGNTSASHPSFTSGGSEPSEAWAKLRQQKLRWYPWRFFIWMFPKIGENPKMDGL